MATSVLPSVRPVFVLGCPRSGTTLLQLMLHAHPRIALPPETRFVLPAYERRLGFGDLREPVNRAALAHWITGRRETRFHELGLDAGDVAGRIAGGPPTLGSALGIALKAYADSHGKARWGDKRPAYALHVEEILRLFPDAQFVHLVRDGRDCVASLLGMPWWHRGFHEAVATWAQVTDVTRRYARRLGPGAWHEVRFEDLITDPEHQLRMICAYLGEEYDPPHPHTPPPPHPETAPPAQQTTPAPTPPNPPAPHHHPTPPEHAHAPPPTTPQPPPPAPPDPQPPPPTPAQNAQQTPPPTPRRTNPP
ncbi:sulfotransferase family protein, partial [Streptomyces shenzhenensis]|uniref:sulfotransferase family protein n=1 Tax=Streptomyces shenzhenensis TaxID=943815 RepID=UPI001C68D640